MSSLISRLCLAVRRWKQQIKLVVASVLATLVEDPQKHANLLQYIEEYRQRMKAGQEEEKEL